jgi:hypothetical protein
MTNPSRRPTLSSFPSLIRSRVTLPTTTSLKPLRTRQPPNSILSLYKQTMITTMLEGFSYPSCRGCLRVSDFTQFTRKIVTILLEQCVKSQTAPPCEAERYLDFLLGPVYTVISHLNFLNTLLSQLALDSNNLNPLRNHFNRNALLHKIEARTPHKNSTGAIFPDTHLSGRLRPSMVAPRVHTPMNWRKQNF